ncbi:MAG: LysR substrate-binding domain-containing protein [Bacteroidales bacterium]
MVTITQLEYIVAVDTYRHFGKAAEMCCITQPTLSMQIKKLEEDLDVVIFDRGKQPLTPTDIGKCIIDQARVILRENKKLTMIIDDYKEDVGGELKIGIIPTIAPYLLPLFIGGFKEKYRNIFLRIEEITTESIIDKLSKDLIDVGILVTPIGDQKLIESPLFYEEMLVYSNEGNPVQNEKKVSVKKLQGQDLLLLNDSHCFRHQILNLCSSISKAEKDHQYSFEAGSLETIFNIIDKDGGVTVIPELSTIDMTEERFENVQRIKDMTPLREISMVYSRHYAKSKLSQILSEEIKASVPEKMLRSERGDIVKWR